ncbi:hypothetical protein HIM_07647 [Hirsutella minnesotensis 3608]|uniref:Uncharacterized protein n=1 Tax=Hirsutella minnesotensis 3608 TaxID=1043627 RepID=A0A0F8A434_9HYPO|nr:hypothetical protein HIM_07647 [Hirsutella minnesotensis 3608]
MGGYCEQPPKESPWIFCRSPSCAKCKSATESVITHKDCLRLFLRDRTEGHATIYHLWRAACRRYVWRWFWPLPPGRGSIDRAVSHASSAWALPLELLPNELQTMICKELSQHIFWRYIRAETFIYGIDAVAEDEAAVPMPLTIISAWKRGSEPRIQSQNNMPIVRLTMDSQGLLEIERLLDVPDYRASLAHGYAFIVEHVGCFQGATAYFNVSSQHSNLG